MFAFSDRLYMEYTVEELNTQLNGWITDDSLIDFFLEESMAKGIYYDVCDSKIGYLNCFPHGRDTINIIIYHWIEN